MRRCIATVSLSGMLREKLQAAAAARFDSVEIFENDLLQFSGSPRDVRNIAMDLGLGSALFQPFQDVEGVNAAQLARNLDRGGRKFDIMQALRVPLILACSNIQPESSVESELVAGQLDQLAEWRANHGTFADDPV